MDLERFREKAASKFSKEGLKKSWPVLAVTALFFVALSIRYYPVVNMEYLQALDSYRHFRISQHLAAEGSHLVTDFMAYFPYNTPVVNHHLGVTVFPAIFYWIGGSLVFESYLGWAQFYPALMGAFSVVAMYFFGKEVANRKVGLATAFFLAVIPGVLRRSSAGFFQKEPTGTFFMMLTLLFFAAAWKRESYKAGIISGLSLAFFTISWGGSQMMWLLLPMTVGSLLFIDEEIRQLVIAYTPTVLIGGGVASVLDYSNFWFTDELFLANVALLGLLWSRYLIGELELMESKYLPYYVPTVSVTGLIAVLLSPLYSDFIAARLISVIEMVTQTGWSVIGGTVAENTPPGLNQLVGSLGAESAGNIHPVLGTLSSIIGSWPMIMIGGGFLGTVVLFMLIRKYELVEEEIDDRIYFAGFEAVFISWIMVVIGLFMDMLISSMLAAGVLIGTFLLFATYLDEENTFRLMTMLTGTGLLLQGILLIAGEPIAITVMPATALVIAGITAMYYNDLFSTRKIEMNWIMILPALWVFTNMLGSVHRSRLIFLSSFAAAFAAGYGLAKIIGGLQSLDLEEMLEFEKADRLKYIAVGVVILTAVAVNFGAALVTASGVGGSPDPAWDQSLNYLDEETEHGDVVMSWWDYGYHFQTIGRSASVADGSNSGYYTDDVRAVNMPLADFLVEDEPDLTFLDQHSVDHMVLDNTMIGKYSAVSQIHNRDNDQADSMLTLATDANMENSISQSGDTTTATFSSGRTGLTVHAEIDITNETIDFADSAPTIEQRTQQGTQRQAIDCIVRESGEMTELDVDTQMPYCLAEDPYFSLERGFQTQLQARAVLIPKDITDSTLVELYFQNGNNLEWAEIVPEASNDYVKTWEVNR